MTTGISYWDTRTLVARNNVAPARCTDCGLTAHRGLSWQVGYDDGTDPNYVGYECCNCGNVQGLTRGAILRRIKRRAGEHR